MMMSVYGQRSEEGSLHASDKTRLCLKTYLAGLHVLLTLLCSITIMTLSDGCSFRSPRFVSGDQVIVTANGMTATGTVVQAELGMNLNRECKPDMLYYEIRFGPASNNIDRSNIVWFQDKCLKKRTP